MSVRKFFEKEREKQKSILRDQIVKRTSVACGVGTATVVRICKEYEGNSGLLSSPEKRYTASRVQIVLDDFNVEAICTCILWQEGVSHTKNTKNTAKSLIF